MLNSQQDRMLHLENYGAADVGKLFQPEKRFKEGAECKCEENDNFQEFSPFCRSTFFKRIYKYMGIYMYMYMYIMIRPRDCDKDNRQRRQKDKKKYFKMIFFSCAQVFCHVQSRSRRVYLNISVPTANNFFYHNSKFREK